MHRSQPFSNRLFLCLAIALASPRLASAQVAWNPAGPSAVSDRVAALAVDPRSDLRVYAGAPGGGVWKTEDGGTNWTPLLETAVSLQVCALAIDPLSPDTIYLGTGDSENPRTAQGIAQSTDGGRTWTFSVRFTNLPVCTLAVDPSDSKRLFAGSGEGLFLSADAGTSWTKVLSTPVTSVAFDGSGTIYAGTLGDDAPGARERILVKSTDGSRNWTYVPLPGNVNEESAETNWVSLAVAGGAISVLVSYESSPNQSFMDFYRSADSGTTWEGTFRIGQSRPPVALVTDPLTGNLFAAGTAFLGATNRGSSWFTIPVKGNGFHAAVFSGGLALLAGNTGLEAAVTSQGAQGRTVTQLPVGQFLDVAFDSFNSIWAAGPSGLYRLFPFTRAADIRAGGVGAVANVAIGPSPSANVFAAGGSAVYTSTDRGDRFTLRSVIPDVELKAPVPPFLIDPLVPSTAYVAGTRLYRTADNGTTWTALSQIDPDATHVVVALATPPAARTVMYAATACLPQVARIPCPSASFFWRSANSGATWVQLSPVSGLITRLAVDPRQPTILYAAVGGFSGGDVLLSTNGGGTWTSVASNLPDVAVNTIVVDPNSLPPNFAQPAQRLYAGTDAGVFVTYNGGGQWTDITGSPEFTRGLPRTPITRLALRSDGTLAAATLGRGTYYASTAGFGATVVVNPLSLDVTVMQGATTTTGLPLTNLSASSTFGFRVYAVDSWLAVQQPSGEIRPGASVRVSVAVSGAGLEVGTYVGRLQVIAGAAVQSILVRAHVTASPAKLTIVGGETISGGTGNTLGPIQIRVSDAKQNPIQGVQVRFAITGGGVLSVRSSVTNAAGIAIVYLTLPSTPGTIKVAVSAGDTTATLTATAIIAPVVFPDSIVDGVTFNIYTAIGAGGVVSISGQNLAEGPANAGVAALPTTLLTTRTVLVTAAGDIPLQLFSVSPSQVRALIPANLAAGIYKLRVEVAARRSNEAPVTIAPFAPGILTQSGTGKGPGFFFKADGSLVTAANAADRGSAVTILVSGLGAVTGTSTARTPRVFFDIYQAEVISSGPAPQAGRYQVTVRVPALLSPATNISVSMTIGGYTSNRVTIPVR